MHALIWQESGSAWLADLGSSNGTYLNGERISESSEIADGDRITFGASEFVIRPPE